MTVAVTGAQAEGMTWIRVRGRATAQRLTAVDAYGFPGSVRQRFAFEHETLSDADLALVESGARQWFRLAAQHPRAKLRASTIVAEPEPSDVRCISVGHLPGAFPTSPVPS